MNVRHYYYARYKLIVINNNEHYNRRPEIAYQTQLRMCSGQAYPDISITSSLTLRCVQAYFNFFTLDLVSNGAAGTRLL